MHSTSSHDLALRIAKLAWEKKAEDIVVLDVSALTQVTDYFVLITGQVDQHIKAISDYIRENLKAEGIRLHHIEGEAYLQWVLMDYIDVVVHLFQAEVRSFYDLEALWGEAEVLPLPLIGKEQEPAHQ